MGSLCDMADIERFMRSPEGEARMNAIAQDFVGKTVTSLEFDADIDRVTVCLVFNSGESSVGITLDELDVDSIRAEYPDMLKREYFVDFPERKEREG